MLVALHYSTAYSQNDFIEWGRGVKIDWTDFKGKAQVNSPFAAMSAVGIHYKYSSLVIEEVIKIKFQINSKFDRTKSWSRSKLQTADVLKHEQLHFDISEIVSREFKKEAENSTYSKNYKNEIIDIFNRYTKYLEKLQKKYDDQTMHSKNKPRQKEWENLIRRELLK